jgi:hypothetical protein
MCCQPALQARHVRRLRTALALDDIELNLLAFFEGAITFAVNGGIVDEYVVAAFDTDEAVPFLSVEPLHSSLHLQSPPKRCPEALPFETLTLFRELPTGNSHKAAARATLSRRNGSHAATSNSLTRTRPGFCTASSAATIISLVRRLLGGSSDLPEGRSGPEPALPPYLVLLPVGFAEPACRQAAGGLLH